MVAALEKRGLPHAYVAFEGEQHGFRRAENIAHALEAELYFYGRVFGFASAESAPIEIRNAENLPDR
jgi:dipeptidyl aminopeptidase/acylaminoacyl peptidase